jgi:hypothetical protein
MRSLLLALLGVLTLVGPAGAQDVDITGNWELTVVTQPSRPPAPMVLKKDGQKTVGTISAPQGEMAVEATIKGSEVVIAFTAPTQNGPLNVRLTGTADREAMKGTVDLGGGRAAEWSARRTATADTPASSSTRIDVTGSWTFEVTTDAGSGTPTFVLKQDGDAISGRYSGQFGEAPVTGTIKGSAVELTVSVSIQETPVRIVYTAVAADNNSMKGTVALGDLASGTFTGKKK